jgi:hypothetical protein
MTKSIILFDKYKLFVIFFLFFVNDFGENLIELLELISYGLDYQIFMI